MVIHLYTHIYLSNCDNIEQCKISFFIFIYVALLVKSEQRKLTIIYV